MPTASRVQQIMKLDSVLLRKILTFFILVFIGACPFSIALSQSALFIGLALSVCIMLWEKKPSVPRSPLDLYFLAYMVVGINSMIFSGEKGMVVIFVKRLSLIPIVYLILGNVTSKRFLTAVFGLLAGVMVVLSLIGIRKYLVGVRGLEGRLELFHHYMTSGGILMMLSLIAFSFAILGTPLKWKVIAFTSGLLMVFALLFTFTRSSWLGFLAGFLVIAIAHSKKALLGVGMILVLFWLTASPSLKDRASSIFNPYHRHNIERLYMWKAGIQIIKDHPLGGVGDVDLKEWYERYKPPEAKQRAGHLHDNLIMFGVTLGVPGLLFFVALSLKLLIMEWKILRSVPKEEWLLKGTVLGALASYLGFQVNGLFEWNFGDAEIAMLLWLTVGLALSAQKIAACALSPRTELPQGDCFESCACS